MRRQSRTSRRHAKREHRQVRASGVVEAVGEGSDAIVRNTGRFGKTLRTRRGGGESVTVVAAADERDEAEYVARELAKRSAGGEWPLEDMAVLYRTNSQSRAMEEAFRRAGVEHRLVGAISFYDRREVKDLLAYLRLVANPADDEAFLRAIAVPRRGIGEASLPISAVPSAAPCSDATYRTRGLCSRRC